MFPMLLKTIQHLTRINGIACSDISSVKLGNTWVLEDNTQVGEFESLLLFKQLTNFNLSSTCMVGTTNGIKYTNVNNSWVVTDGLDCSNTTIDMIPHEFVKSLSNGVKWFISYGNNGSSVYYNNYWEQISNENVTDVYSSTMGFVFEFGNKTTSLYNGNKFMPIDIEYDHYCAFGDKLYVSIDKTFFIYQLSVENLFGPVGVVNSKADYQVCDIFPSFVLLDRSSTFSLDISSNSVFEMYSSNENLFLNTFTQINGKTTIELTSRITEYTSEPGKPDHSTVLVIKCSGQCTFKNNDGKWQYIQYVVIAIFIGCPHDAFMLPNQRSIHYEDSFSIHPTLFPNYLNNNVRIPMNLKLLSYKSGTGTFKPIYSMQTDLLMIENTIGQNGNLQFHSNATLSFVCHKGSECADVIDLSSFPKKFIITYLYELQVFPQSSYCKLTIEDYVDLNGLSIGDVNELCITFITFVIVSIYVVLLSMKNYRKASLEIQK